MILKDKSVLVTGGTGSMGKVLIKRMLSGEIGMPSKIIVFSRDEAKHYAMRTGDFKEYDSIIEYRIGDVRNYDDVCSAVKASEIVINAAALKQVPSCEYQPDQAILTNCMGAINIVKAVEKYPVHTVVGISTDKACKPVNAMGMSKALQEKIFISGNLKVRCTRFIVVRYGNVLASRGSVIPLFLDQIRRKSDITITDDRMTRFLLSLDRAVDTVFTALRLARRGDTVIPVVPSAKVKDIALVLRNNNPNFPSGNNNVVITGIRPGEKIHEILVSEEEISRTYYYPKKFSPYYFIKPLMPDVDDYIFYKDALPALTKEYSSEDNLLTYDEVEKLLRKNSLLNYSEKEEELLR